MNHLDWLCELNQPIQLKFPKKRFIHESDDTDCLSQEGMKGDFQTFSE